MLAFGDKPIDLTIGDAASGERRDAAANRQRILDAAEQLFAEFGVADVSMAQVARTAGVGKGTLYRRFSGKADLCLALMDVQMRSFQTETLAALQSGAAQSPVEQLETFLVDLVQFTDRNNPLLCAAQSEGLVGESAVMEEPYLWQYMTVNGLLLRAQRMGLLAPELDVAYLADALLAPLNPSLFRFQRDVRGFSVDRIADGMRSLLDALTG